MEKIAGKLMSDFKPSAENRPDALAIPPGWRSNPSSWSERLPLIGLALTGSGISVYLALYQLRIVPHVWEPFFGDGSQRVLLHSPIAQLLPIPDALLGALGYATDVILGLLGGQQRWRTHPRVVVVFGLVVMAMALVSLALIFCQPLLAHACCTLCLCSALISFLIAGLAVKELRATLQHLKRQRHLNRSHDWRPRTT